MTRVPRARCHSCRSRRVYADVGGTVCPVCNGDPRHWRARLYRLVTLRRLRMKLPWGYWSGFGTARGHRGAYGPAGKP